MEEQIDIIEEVLEEEEQEKDFTEESLKYYKKLKRKTIVAFASMLVIFISIFFEKYEDFDVALSSTLFMGLLGMSIGATIGTTIYLYKTRLTLSSETVMTNLKKINDIFDVVSIVPVFIAIVSISNTMLISPATVVQTSMEPNYHEGDNILVYHLFENYKRYDVVILKAGDDDYFIKRIIGLPGETITIKNGEIYIGAGSEEELLNDPTILKEGAETYCQPGASGDPEDVCTFVVPQGTYFVLGDNREGSNDSRVFEQLSYLDVGTYIPEDKLYGKVILKLDFLN